jgi:predicted Zn finger-like uncharacterized protein
MYTQCPQCQVFFRITTEQLAARRGVVRCGKCGSVFRADQQLFKKLPHKAETITRGGEKPGRRRRAATPPGQSPLAPPATLPLFPPPPAQRPAQLALWSVAGAVAAVVLAAQFAHFYRVELARHAPLRPYVELYCEWLDCETEPPPDVNRIDFETSIAPHPRYVNALRLRADLVNRANYAQPFPRIEVTLTDSEGRTLARRAFEASRYLAHAAVEAATAPSLARGPADVQDARMSRRPGMAESGLDSRTESRAMRQGRRGDGFDPIGEDDMAPNVAHHALLDLTNPDNRAVGYEVRLLPAD